MGRMVTAVACSSIKEHLTNATTSQTLDGKDAEGIPQSASLLLEHNVDYANSLVSVVTSGAVAGTA